MPNPNDVFLDTLSEASDVDLDEAILAIQTLDINENRVWEFMRLYILSRFINERGHLHEEREPRQTDKREGEPSFFVEFGEDDDGETTAALHFYTGEQGGDWIEVASGGTSSSSSDVTLPDLATEANMATGTLTTRVGVSPHLIRHAIESYTNAFTDTEQTKLGNIETEATADQTASEIIDLLEAETGDDQLDASLALRNLPESTTELTTTQVQDETDDTHGTVSGERLEEAISHHVQPLTTTQIEDETSNVQGTVSGERFKEAFDNHLDEVDSGGLTTAEQEKLDNIETDATADQTATEIKTAYESNSDTNVFADAEQTKLSGIEDSATADQTVTEIATAIEGQVRDEHIASDLTSDEQSNIRTKIGATDVEVNVDGVTIEEDSTDGLRVKEGGLDDSHIKSTLTSNEKQEFRGRIDAADENALTFVNTSDVGSNDAITFDNAVGRLQATGITLPATSETEWLQINIEVGEVQSADWHRIQLQALYDLGDATIGATQTNSTALHLNNLFSGTSDVVLGRSSANELLIGYISAGVPSATFHLIVKQIGTEDGMSTTGGDTDITISRDADSVTVASSTGTDDDIGAADTDNAGVMTAEHFDKLEGQEDESTADQTPEEIKISYESNADTNAFADADKTKLDGIDDSDTDDQTAEEIATALENLIRDEHIADDLSGTEKDNFKDKLDIPSDIVEPILIFARSADSDPGHPTGSVSNAGVLSVNGDWDRHIPLEVGGDQSDTIDLNVGNTSAVGVARYDGKTYVADDGTTKKVFVYDASNVYESDWNLHADNGDPQGITVTPDGRVFIPDGTGEQFFEYTISGTHRFTHDFQSGAFITGASSDEYYLYFLNSSIKQVYVYTYGGGLVPGRERAVPISGVHNFHGLAYKNGRDYVLNSTGSSHEIRVYRNGAYLSGESQDLASGNTVARGLDVNGQLISVVDSNDNQIYIYGSEGSESDPLFVAEAYVNLSDSTVSFSEFFEVDVSKFNLYDDTDTELTSLDDDDRFIVTDFSANGKPNRYVKLSTVRDAVVSTTDDTTIDDTTIGRNADDELEVKDGGIRDEHIADDLTDEEKVTAKTRLGVVDGTTVTVDNTTIEDDETDGLRVKDGGISHEKLAEDSVDGSNIESDTIDSEHYIDGSIDTEHIADENITLEKMADDSVGQEQILDDAIGTEHYQAGSVDNEALGLTAIRDENVADDLDDTEKKNVREKLGIPRFTTGGAVPTDPLTNDIHSYDTGASSLTNHRSNSDTTDITSAVRGDIFKYNGTNWIKEIAASAVSGLENNSVRDEHIANDLTDTEQENFLEKIGGNQRYHHTVDRVYEALLPRTGAQYVVIALDTGNFYRVYMGNYNSDLIENFLNSLGRRAEVVIENEDGDVDWTGHLESVFDDDETSATLRVEFLADDRNGTFTDSENITISFGYSPINEQMDNETIERNTDGEIALKDEGIRDEHIADDLTDTEQENFRDKIGVSLTTRGMEIARTNTIAATGAAVFFDTEWTLASDIPTGFGNDTALTPAFIDIPQVPPSYAVDGLWAILYLDGVETDSAVLDWGPGGSRELASGELEFTTSPLYYGASKGFEIIYQQLNSSATRISLRGDNKIILASEVVTVRIFLKGVFIE